MLSEGQTKNFLTEDEITDLFSDYLMSKGWEILSRAKGQSRGADIVARQNGKVICIEAKGGGSQAAHTKRYGLPFTRLQSQHHTDVAFACIPRMMTRYKPDFVGIVLPDDKYHFESLSEILPAIKKLGAGVWLVSNNSIRELAAPIFLG